MPRILVAEDDEMLSRMYQEMLVREGFEVTSANTGALALVRVTDTPTDLVLLDMMMPGQSGLDFLKELNLHPVSPRPKIIVTSNIDNPSIVEQARAEGIDGYLVKASVTPKEIVAQVKMVLAGPAAAPSPTDMVAPQ